MSDTGSIALDTWCLSPNLPTVEVQSITKAAANTQGAPALTPACIIPKLNPRPFARPQGIYHTPQPQQLHSLLA